MRCAKTSPCRGRRRDLLEVLQIRPAPLQIVILARHFKSSNMRLPWDFHHAPSFCEQNTSPDSFHPAGDRRTAEILALTARGRRYVRVSTGGDASVPPSRKVVLRDLGGIFRGSPPQF